MLTKKNKKIIISASVATLLTAAAISPIAFATSEYFNQSILNSNRSITSGGYSIDSNGLANFGTTGASTTVVNGANVTTYNPNSYKAIPTGYVIQKGNYLVCVDKDNLEKVLWSDQYNNWYINNVEYLPDSDTLVTLYTTKDVKKDQRYTIKIGLYQNISSTTNGGTPNFSPIVIADNKTYGGDAYRPDLYSMTPIICEDKPATEFIIYPKSHNKGSDSWAQTWWKFNVTTNSFSELPRVQYEMTDQLQAILSLGALRKADGSMVVNAVMMRNGNAGKGGWTQSSTWTFTNDDANVSTEIRNNYFDEADSYLIDVVDGSVSKSDFYDVLATTISVPSIYYAGGNEPMVFSHMQNMTGNKSSNIKTEANYNSRFLTSWVNNQGQNSGRFVRTIGPSSNNNIQMFSGYFDNSAILALGTKKGATAYGPSFIGVIRSDNALTSSSVSYNNMVMVVKNSTASENGNLSITNNLNSADYRLYPITTSSDANVSNKNVYTQPGQDNQSVFLLDNGLNGIPMLEFNSNYSEAYTNPWKSNVLLTANNKAKSILINQESRGQSISIAKYSWYTRVINTSIEITPELDANASSTPVDNVTLEYINEKFGIESNNYASNDFIKNNIGMLNPRSDSFFAIKPNSITRNPKSGSVTFDLYMTAGYSSNGQLYITDQLSRLKENWWADHKLATITLVGYYVATTQFPENNSDYSFGNSATSASSFYDNNNENVKNLIFEKKDELFKYLPNSFNASNINIVSVNTNDTEGKLTVTFNINNWYDEDGNLRNENSSDTTIVLTGFKTSSNVQSGTKYIVTTPQAIGDSSVLPTDFASQTGALQKLIFDNISTMFSNLPDGMSQDNVVIGSITSTNNLTGELQATFTINKYWSAEGVLTNDNEFGSLNITITGFKTQKPTVLPNENEGFNFGDNAHVPTDFYNNQVSKLQDLIFANKDQIFENLPSDFEAVNIVIEPSGVRLDNLSGTIEVTFTLNNWYNNQGEQVSTNSQTCTIKINGFKTQQATSFPTNNAEFAFGNNQQLASQYYNNDNTKIQQLIFDNKDTLFNNLPNDFGKDNINITSVVATDSKGTLKVTLTINNYFNEQGVLTSLDSNEISIIVAGFKKPSTTLDGGKLTLASGDPFNFYASQWQDNLTSIKQAILLQKKIINPATDFISIQDIDLANVIADNSKGELQLSLTIKNNKAQVDGNPVTIVTLGPVTFTGFLVGEPDTTNTTLADNISISNTSFADMTVTSVDIQSNEFKELLIPYIQYPTEGQTITVDDILTSLTSSDPTNGTMLISVTVLNGKASTDGEPVENGKVFKNITITGFKPISNVIVKPDSNKKDNNMGKIIGGVIAIIGGVILIGVVVWLAMRSKKNN